jgi:N-methylhydantoinase A
MKKIMRIGVDTGGTFTDCVLIDGGQIGIVKVFSGSSASPQNATAAILEGIRHVTQAQSGDSVEIVHGTTLSTNSLLERQGARVALVTTHGFEDLIEIGRQTRPQLYNLDVRRAPPLVPRKMRFGLRERTAADGSILMCPSKRELQDIRNRLKKCKAESIALCLLFAFANPTIELLVLRELQKLEVPISVSHRILPEFREYERLSAVAINAFLMPRIGSYLTQLERKASRDLCHRSARKEAPAIRVFVMESSGGITTAARAAREPVRTILSGPAGGVAAAAWLMERLEIRQAITFDMGGTSTDVCLLDGRPPITNETTIGDLPVAVPVIDVRSVGAGGGSLVRMDAGGALRVGPESAGASPGPVCYGRGGRNLTVTDANLILGRLDPQHFLGGTFALNAEASEKQFHQFLRRHSGKGLAGGAAFRSPIELARGIIAVANANMERALRVISVERGYDPRDFALLAFGGAGGLHCADLGRALGVRKIIVPPYPGTFSALGILLSDLVKDVSQSILLPVPESEARTSSAAFNRFHKDLVSRFRRLERDARAELRRDHFPSGAVRVERHLDVRYAGQSYELKVAFSAKFPEDFKRMHEKTYGYAHERQRLEVVNLRLRLTIPTSKPRLAKQGKRVTGGDVQKAIVSRRKAWFGNRFFVAPLYNRELLPAGARFRGPAVVAEYSSTTVVPPDFLCSVDSQLNLVLSQNAN